MAKWRAHLSLAPCSVAGKESNRDDIGKVVHDMGEQGANVFLAGVLVEALQARLPPLVILWIDGMGLKKIAHPSTVAVLLTLG
jgi:hypothetical protein